MQIKFWGTRGSIPTSGASFVEFGGNTPCLSVGLASSRDLLVLESGTGIRDLGQWIVDNPDRHTRTIHLFLTHAHWDHIQGFPFFSPAYLPDYTVHVYCTKDAGAFLKGQMSAPFFPVGLDVMQASLEFHRLDSKRTVALGDAAITNIPLPHPQESTAFRVDEEGRSFVFATDTEHDPDGGVNEQLVEFSRGADILVYDAQYTPEEYRDGKQGWGHSTYQEGVRIARAAGAKKLVLFSHDPYHSDDDCREIERLAKGEFADAVAARQGMTLSL